MSEPKHIAGREACPYLPLAPDVMLASDTRALRAGNDHDAYYLATLECAQSLWLQGKPAQALLQLNHALGVEIAPGSQALMQWPLPYQAIVWMFTRRHEDGFLGNPVRHYQHLASRMSGPRKELRSWRAWACFHLAENVLPEAEFPRDQRQIEREQLIIPSSDEVLKQLSNRGTDMDIQILRALLC